MNGDSPRDYDHPEDGNTPRTWLATLYDTNANWNRQASG